MRTLLFTSLALVAFAANSVLCRLALGEHTIDAASFTIIRLTSGAVALGLILSLRGSASAILHHGSWRGAFSLFLYAAAFSFAYLSLTTGTGALILFGSVQLTMILVSLYQGERLHAMEWTGVVLAFAGFVWLVLPGVAAPSPSGFALMTVAGIAWGAYTLLGRGSTKPLSDTSANFLRTLPFLALLLPAIVWRRQLTTEGVILAMSSGAIASGVGYAIWYRALAGLNSTSAAVVQLSVPVIAAAGGAVFVAEAISLRLAISSLMILGGIAVVIGGRSRASRQTS
jgi:drug/metabolite transporter (DMT)-like permease